MAATFPAMHQDADTRAYQRFLGELRRFWAGPLFSELKSAARERLQNRAPDAPSDSYAWLDGSAEHEIFGWLEFHMQQMKYAGRWGLARAAEADREMLETALSEPLPEGLLSETPDLTMPDYYQETDFHHHPGGLGRDSLAAVLYRESAGGSGGVVGNASLHDRFAALAVGETDHRSVVDIGCGFGRSTLAFRRHGKVENAIGIDLSAACTRLAAQITHLGGETEGVRYIQADGAAVPLPDASADVVTSTMLLHELPPDAIRDMIRESYRLLSPGGIAVHLDFLPPEDPFLQALYYGHSDRNGEPFMRTLAAMDLAAEHSEAGFESTEISPFAETDAPSDEKWRLPWTVILARKSEAA